MRRKTKGLADQFNVIDRYVALAAFQRTYERPVQPCFGRHTFLGHPRVNPDQPDVAGEYEP